MGDALESIEAMAEETGGLGGAGRVDDTRCELLDLAVWHRSFEQPADPAAEEQMLRRLVRLLTPHGMLVVLQPYNVGDDVAGQGGDGGGGLLASLPSEPGLRVVALPSPDADQGLVLLVTRVCQEFDV